MNRRLVLPTLLFMAGLLAVIILIARATNDNTPPVSKPAAVSPKKAAPIKRPAGTTGPRVVPLRTSMPAAARRPTLPPAPRSVQAVVDSFGVVARNRYQAACRAQGINWPPARLTLLAFKRERRLEVWGANAEGAFAQLGNYPVLAASGGPGPKRKEGDRQVPEGAYLLTELNPNSQFHLSIRVEYPNSLDISHSRLDRSEMGGDIYIHGNKLSIGCLAIGDRAIEEVFTLAALVRPGARRIVIAPFDFRRNPKTPYPREEAWVHDMYDRIRQELRMFPSTPTTAAAHN